MRPPIISALRSLISMIWCSNYNIAVEKDICLHARLAQVAHTCKEAQGYITGKKYHKLYVQNATRTRISTRKR